MAFNRSNLIRNSNIILRENKGISRSTALKRAYKRRFYIDLFDADRVHFTYKKKNGQKRVALGTNIPSEIPPTEFETKSKNVVVYYDLNKKGWRSFRIENI